MTVRLECRRAAGLMALAAGLLTPVLASGQDGGALRPIDSTRVRRCHPNATAVCVELLGELGSGAHGGTPGVDADTTRTWTLRLGSPAFMQDRVETGGFGRPTLLLILMDVSGSMLQGSGGRTAAVTRFDNTRAALRSFIQQLSPSRVRVAVAPFGSEAVDATIAAAAFLTPAGADSALSRIPQPSPDANTALYSAVRAGARRLDEMRRGRANRRTLLLVVSDGRNDIGTARDLLPNDSLTAATREIRAAGVEPFLLGVGDNLPLPQLDSLAVGSARPYVTAADAAGSIAERLRQMLVDMGDRRVLFWTGEDIATMGRLVRNAGLNGDDGPVRPVAWSPPLIALPAFEYPASRAVAAAWARDQRAREGDGTLLLGRLAYVAVIAAVLGLAWWVVPRWLWPPVLMEREVLRERTDVAASPAAPLGASGLRRDVREAEPRSPAAVTGEYPIAAR